MINEEEFMAVVTDVLRSELDRTDLAVKMSSSPRTISEWDSLAQIRIIMGIERAFSIQLDADEIEGLDSVKAFFDAVTRHRR